MVGVDGEQMPAVGDDAEVDSVQIVPAEQIGLPAVGALLEAAASAEHLMLHSHNVAVPWQFLLVSGAAFLATLLSLRCPFSSAPLHQMK